MADNSAIDLEIIAYDEKYALETVKMWRASMEKALQWTDPHSIEDQLNYLASLVEKCSVFLAIDRGRTEPSVDSATEKVVGFMAVDGSELEQLYVHVDYQGAGIGTRLLNLAKERAPGLLQLYTFEINQTAQRFYEKHGFTIIARGIEPDSGRADIRYEWARGD